MLWWAEYCVYRQQTRQKLIRDSRTREIPEALSVSVLRLGCPACIPDACKYSRQDDFRHLLFGSTENRRQNVDVVLPKRTSCSCPYFWIKHRTLNGTVHGESCVATLNGSEVRQGYMALEFSSAFECLEATCYMLGLCENGTSMKIELGIRRTRLLPSPFQHGAPQGCPINLGQVAT